jgi:hypothetical protein
MKLTPRGELVADLAAFLGCIVAVCAWSAVAYLIG